MLDIEDDHELFCAVYEHVGAQLGDDQWAPESDLARNLPEVPRTVYYSFSLAAEVGGNGFEVSG